MGRDLAEGVLNMHNDYDSWGISEGLFFKSSPYIYKHGRVDQDSVQLVGQDNDWPMS